MKKSIVILLSGIVCWMVSPLVVAQDANTETQGAASESQGVTNESQGVTTEKPPATEPEPILMPVPQVTTNTYPISEVDRPLAMPRLMIRPEADLGMNFFKLKKGHRVIQQRGGH